MAVGWYRFLSALSKSQNTGYRIIGSGTAVLVGGTVTVANTQIAAASILHLTRQVTGGTVGHLTKGTVVAGVSFDINSSSASDTSTIGWSILAPIA